MFAVTLITLSSLLKRSTSCPSTVVKEFTRPFSSNCNDKQQNYILDIIQLRRNIFIFFKKCVRKTLLVFCNKIWDVV